MKGNDKPPVPVERQDCWILHASARQYHWAGVGWLSIKTFTGGRAHYTVGRGHHAVDETSYLILNEGHTYGINIDSRTRVESFCVFFAPSFAEEVHRSLSHKAEQLLDEPEPGNRAPIHFFEKNYSHDRLLSPALFRLQKEYRNQDRHWLTEQLHGIVERLLAVHQLERKQTMRLNAIRAATREELYRRVCRGRDYASALFAEPITLNDLAGAACLSPNHFLRTFRQLFGQTPHQFLTDRRLHEARRLLAQEQLPVTEVCLAVGFESLGSFSTLFRKRFGVSPSQFRQSKK